MEDMKVLDTLKEKVLTELNPIATKASLTPTDISVAKEAVCLLKEIEEVFEKRTDGGMETSEGRRGSHISYGYHHDPYMYDGYAYGYYQTPGRMYSYGDERMMDHHSMARGRSPITGRYVSRDGDMDTSGRRYTFSYDTDPQYRSYGRSYEQRRDTGRSGHSIDDRIVDMLEHMMDNEDSNYARNKINTIIRVVESMRGE